MAANQDGPWLELVNVAQTALKRITNAEHSEVCQLWAETNEFDAWLAIVAQVDARLTL